MDIHEQSRIFLSGRQSPPSRRVPLYIWPSHNLVTPHLSVVFQMVWIYTWYCPHMRWPPHTWPFPSGIRYKWKAPDRSWQPHLNLLGGMFNEYDGAAVTLHSLHLEVSGRVIHIDDLSAVTLQHLGLYLSVGLLIYRNTPVSFLTASSCTFSDGASRSMIKGVSFLTTSSCTFSDGAWWIVSSPDFVWQHTAGLPRTGVPGPLSPSDLSSPPQICSGQIVNQSFQYIFLIFILLFSSVFDHISERQPNEPVWRSGRPSGRSPPVPWQ